MVIEKRLKYKGTQIDIRLGDNILFKNIIFGKSKGVVCYVPGESPLHPEMEYEGEKNWAIKLENGRVISWLYLPEEYEANKRVVFVKRGNPFFEGLKPDDELI